MTALAKTDHNPETPVVSAQIVNADATSLMAVISRAASDPNTDVDKLERLMGLYERITDRGATSAYDEAFAEMQAALPSIDESGQIIVKEKGSEKVIQSTSYAKQADINDVVKPILGQYGFGLSFRPGRTAEGLVSMTAILSHRLGHREEATVTLQQDGSGSKNSVQGVGSSLTYAKRYATIAILNISSRAKIDMDDDGQGASLGLAAQRALSDINLAESYEALRAWKASQYDGVSKVVQPQELRQIIELYNRRIKATKPQTVGA